MKVLRVSGQHNFIGLMLVIKKNEIKNLQGLLNVRAQGSHPARPALYLSLNLHVAHEDVNCMEIIMCESCQTESATKCVNKRH